MNVPFVSASHRWFAPALAFVAAAIVFHVLGHNPVTELYGGGDGYMTGLPSKIFVASFSSWNPWVQLGQYTYQDLQYQAFYLPGLLVMRAFPDTFGYNLFIFAHYVAAGLFTFLYLRNLGLGRFAAVFGGLCFELSGFLYAHKGHTAIVSAAIWLPLMLYAVDRHFQTGRIRHLAIGALAVGMSLLGGFPQVTLYSMLLTSAYACWRAATLDQAGMAERSRRLAWTLGIILGLGTLTAAIQIVPVAASLSQLTRERLTYEMFSQNALPLYSVFCFVMPNLFGGLYGVVGYGTDLSGVEIYPYMGLLPLALAAGAVYACASVFRDARFWAAVALVALVVAFGPETPLHRVLFAVPVYNLFRASARHLLEINFAMCVLAAAAVETLASPARADVRRRLVRWATAILIASFGVSLIAALALGTAARYAETPAGAFLRNVPLNGVFTVGQVTNGVIQNVALTSRTLVQPALFLVLSLGVLVWLLRNPHGRGARAALVAVMAADVYLVHSAIYKYPDTTRAFHPDTLEEVAAVHARGYDASRDRVYPLESELIYTYPVLNVLSHVSVINGYTPMWGKRYQFLSGFYNNGAQLPERVADVKFLSVTSARFVLTRLPSLRSRLRAASLPQGSRPVASRTPLSSEWTLDRAGSIENGFTLRSPAPTSLSLAGVPIALQPSTFYNVRFEARAATAQTAPLSVDFYGTGYDDALQNRFVTALTNRFEEQSLTMDAGPAPAADAMLRFVTQSTSTIEVRRVRILTMSPADPSPFEEVTVTHDGISVFQNRNALPRFRFASSLVPAADVVDAKRAFDEPAFDYAHVAIVEGLDAAQTVEPGEIVSQTVANTDMRWQLRTGARSFFVVGDTFFPGWTATVDGRPAQIYPVDGFLRGVFVEGSGEHDVRMVFRPEQFWLGVAGTAAGLGGLAVIWFGGVPGRRRKDPHES